MQEPECMTPREQFELADREVDRAASTIAGVVNELLDKVATEMPAVTLDYPIERLLLTLIREHNIIATLEGLPQPGNVTARLSNAMADYCNSRWPG
jgi:hypothetical protein